MDADLIDAIGSVETPNYNPEARSPKGAIGPLQVMPENMQKLAPKGADWYDPEVNVPIGIQLLKEELDRYHGDTSLALAAYNAGPSKVNKRIRAAVERGIDPNFDSMKAAGLFDDLAETRDYVPKVLKNYEAIKNTKVEKAKATYQDEDARNWGTPEEFATAALDVATKQDFDALSIDDKVRRLSNVYDSRKWMPQADKVLADTTEAIWLGLPAEERGDLKKLITPNLALVQGKTDEEVDKSVSVESARIRQQLKEHGLNPAIYGNALDEMFARKGEKVKLDNSYYIGGKVLKAGVGEAVKGAVDLYGSMTSGVAALAGAEETRKSALGWGEAVGGKHEFLDYELNSDGSIATDEYGLAIPRQAGNVLRMLGGAVGMIGSVKATAAGLAYVGLSSTAAGITTMLGMGGVNALQNIGQGYEMHIQVLPGDREGALKSGMLAAEGAIPNTIADMAIASSGFKWASGLSKLEKIGVASRVLTSKTAYGAVAAGANQLAIEKGVEAGTKGLYQPSATNIKAAVAGGAIAGAAFGAYDLVTAERLPPTARPAPAPEPEPAAVRPERGPVPEAATVGRGLPEVDATGTRLLEQPGARPGLEAPPRFAESFVDDAEERRIGQQLESFKNRREGRLVVDYSHPESVPRSMVEHFQVNDTDMQDGTVAFTKRESWTPPEGGKDIGHLTDVIDTLVEDLANSPNPRDREKYTVELKAALEEQRSLGKFAEENSSQVNAVVAEKRRIEGELRRAEGLRRRTRDPIRQAPLDEEVATLRDQLKSVDDFIATEEGQAVAVKERILQLKDTIIKLDDPLYANNHAAKERAFMQLTQERAALLESKGTTASYRDMAVNVKTGQGERWLLPMGNGKWYPLGANGKPLGKGTYSMHEALFNAQRADYGAGAFTPKIKVEFAETQPYTTKRTLGEALRAQKEASTTVLPQEIAQLKKNYAAAKKGELEQGRIADKSKIKLKVGDESVPVFVTKKTKSAKGESLGAVLRKRAKGKKGAKAKQAVQAMTVSHGGPNKWPAEEGFPYGRFKLEKIGTGEGAAAYGWGAYVAENEGVASHYLPDEQALLVGDKQYTRSYSDRPNRKPSQKAADYVFRKYDELMTTDINEAMDASLADIAHDIKIYRKEITYEAAKSNPEQSFIKWRKKLLEEELKTKSIISAWRLKGATLGEAGTLYKLDLPDEVIPKLLDWDTDLASPQQQHVRDAVKRIYEKDTQVGSLKKKKWGDLIGGKEHNVNPLVTGEGLYSSLASILGSNEAASKALAKEGIPGVKYLDNPSRSKGEGSRNLVIWNQDILDQTYPVEINKKPTGLKPRPPKVSFSGTEPNVLGSSISEGATKAKPKVRPLSKTQAAGTDTTTVTPEAVQVEAIPNKGENYENQHQLIKKMDVFFKKKVEQARMAGKVIGNYLANYAKPLTRFKGDVRTALHEHAHGADDVFGLGNLANSAMKPGKEELIKEMIQLGRGGSGGPDETLDYNLKEGAAEGVHQWMLAPAHTEKTYPKFVEQMKRVLPEDFVMGIRRLGDDIRRSYGAPASKQVEGQIQMTPEAYVENLADYIKKQRKAFRKFTTGEVEGEYSDFIQSGLEKKKEQFLSPLDIVEKATRAITTETGIKLLPSKDPYVAAKQVLGINTIADTILTKGVPDPFPMTDKESKPISKSFISLRDHLDQSGSAADMLREQREFHANMLVDRFYELGMQKELGLREDLNDLGPITGIAGTANHYLKGRTELDMADAYKAEVTSTWSAEKKARAKEYSKQYRDIGKAAMDYAVAKGLLAADTVNNIKARNQFYVAMSRVMDDEGILAVARGKKPIYAVKGSGRQIRNPGESLFENVVRLVDLSNKNAFRRSFTDLLDTGRTMYSGKKGFGDIGREVSGQEAFGDKSVTTVYNGDETKYYKLHPAIKNALDNFTSVTSNEFKIPNSLGLFARVLKFGVSRSLSFFNRNTVRDFWDGVGYTDANKLKAISTRLKNIGKMLTGQELGEYDLESIGGGQSGIIGKDPLEYTKAMMSGFKEVAKDKGSILFMPARKVGNTLKAIDNYLAKSEVAGRVSEYQLQYDKARNELGYNPYDARLYAMTKARDMMDFAVAGTVMKELEKIFPYTNAGIQGTIKYVKEARNNPKNFILSQLMISVLPTLLMREWNDSAGADDLYNQLPEWRKRLFWNYRVGDSFWITMPKGFSNVIVSAATDSIVDYNKGNSTALESFKNSFGAAVSSVMPFGPEVLLPIVRPAAEVMLNKSIFKEGVIVPVTEENAALNERKQAKGTSLFGEAVQGIAEAAGLSDNYIAKRFMNARAVDYLMKGFFGNLGGYITSASDIGRESGGQPLNWDKFVGLTRDTPVYNTKDVDFVQTYAQNHGISSHNKHLKNMQGAIDAYFSAPAGKKDEYARNVYSIAGSIRKGVETLENAGVSGANYFGQVKKQ